MVKKARLKFLIFSLVGLIFSASCMFALSCLTLKNSAEHEIENELTEIENFHEQEFTTFSGDHFMCLISSYNFQNGELILKTEKAVGYSEEEINKFVSTALERRYPLGSIGNVYYKINFENDSPQSVVAADFTYVISAYKENINSTLFSIIFFIVILEIIIWLFSFWVFKPVEETLYKQRQFISDVSHELKTPVAIISANTDVLRNSNSNEYLDNVKTQTERMGLLVNDLLTLSSIDEGTAVIKKQVFSASETVLKTVLPFDALAFEKGKFLRFEIDENLYVKGASEDLAKICEILIDNAVKYSIKGREIIVSLKKDSGKIRLTVFNNGCNVSKEDKERIFERFYRADNSRSREKGGSGLGLSIAKSLALRNAWQIVAHPKLNESMEITLSMKEKQEINN